jgi:AcrR family transcriptional regulator
MLMIDRSRLGGRPRQSEIDDRIKQSAIDLLNEEGLARLSVNRICQRADVPRATFYRRWQTANAVLVDAFNDRIRWILLVDTGDVRADLCDWAIRLRDYFNDPFMITCRPIMSELHRTTPDLVGPMTVAHQERITIVVGKLAAAFSAQEIQPLLGPHDIVYTIQATIDHGLIHLEIVSDAFLRRLVNALLQQPRV